MIQNIRLRLEVAHHAPLRPDRQQRRLAKRIDLESADEGDLLQLDFLAAFEDRLAVATERDDGERGAGAEAPAELLGFGVADFEDALGQPL